MLNKPDRRYVRRKEKARMVKKPKDLDLNRREDSPASEALSAAVVAALMLGQSPTVIAQRFGLDPVTVRRWGAAYDISSPLKRRDNLSEMIMVFIEQELSSLMAISIATSDEEWIKRQDASEIAMLVGVKQDRIMAVLAAYSKAQTSKQAIQGTIQGEVVSDTD